MVWVGLKATLQSYPAEGLREDDPRLAPFAGLLVSGVRRRRPRDRLGQRRPRPGGPRDERARETPAAWEAAVEGWTERITDDVVVATMYGQLFSQVGELPRRR